VSDPRHPGAFQRGWPGDDAPIPQPRRAAQPEALPRPEPRTPAPASGNRVILHGAEADGAEPAPRRNLALVGIVVLGCTQLALALLGGLWAQDFLQGADEYWGTETNPDGMLEVHFGEQRRTFEELALPRLLVQLAPTFSVLGTACLLAAAALRTLARRPR
jgi:hypothetical protein